MSFSSSLRDQIFFVIKDNPGILRTEIRDKLAKPNNVVTPAIKELIDDGLVIEGSIRASRTTGKNGRTLFIADEWQKELDAQNRLWPD